MNEKLKTFEKALTNAIAFGEIKEQTELTRYCKEPVAIYAELMKAVIKHCSNYESDIMHDIFAIQELINAIFADIKTKSDDLKSDYVYLVAIRENRVDSFNFFATRVNDFESDAYFKAYYRKVYLIKITPHKNEDFITVTLLDVKSTLHLDEMKPMQSHQKDSANITKTINLSTGHLRPKTVDHIMATIAQNAIDPAFSAYELKENNTNDTIGYLLYILPNESDNTPADLKFIIDDCKNKNVTSIIFDRDEAICSDYPDYTKEWDYPHADYAIEPNDELYPIVAWRKDGNEMKPVYKKNC